ncbi:MAG TPA: ORF6N domain-containing protein [Steroidobacteraceae bacterium]|nr:ORF6N domain-containing protein [Steroidobacteraceae bacterium]
MSKHAEPSPAEIAGQISVVRGKRVMMDSELAKLYGTETRVLNQAVRRNRERFPGDFVIELTHQEVKRSRSQSVILNAGRGSNVKHPPLAFTEHGAIMVATVLNSPRAVQMTVFVVRAFVKMREGLLVNAVLAREIAALKARMDTMDASTRNQFEQVFEAILGLAGPPGGKQ